MKNNYSAMESALDSINYENGMCACIVPTTNQETPHDFTRINCRSDIEYLFEGMDCKNGIEIEKTSGGYAFRVYGQSFTTDGGETWHTFTEKLVIFPETVRYF